MEERIIFSKKDLAQLPKSFILELFMNYSDCINVRLNRPVLDNELGVEISKENLCNVIEQSGTADQFFKWVEKHGHGIDFSDF